MKQMLKRVKSVLLVESNSRDVRSFREMFSEAAAECAELAHAASSAEAVAYLAQHAVDVILIDMILPEVDGLASLKQVRAAAPRVAVVVISGSDSEPFTNQVLQEGAQDCLVKGQFNARGLVRAVRNAIERKFIEDALLKEKERAQITLNCIGDAVACTDASGKVTYINAMGERLTGWSWLEASGRPMSEVFQVLDVATRDTVSLSIEKQGGADRADKVASKKILVRRDGSEIPIEESVAPIHDRDGLSSGTVVVFRDVSAALAMAMKMSHSAHHDFLTGLPNRMLLNDRVTHSISLALRNAQKVGVLFMDLDGFKYINDSLGHRIGDKLLQSVSTRLVSCLRGSDTVSRQGGDEFVALLSGLEHSEDAAITARRILKSVAEVHSIEHHNLHVTSSIGLSIYPDDGQDADTLIRNADTAMYQAKENGRNCYRFFRPKMNAKAAERQALEEALRCALERREFTLNYQPKINLATGEITGAEALVRWTHPTRGLVPPSEFIPIAEDTGLIRSIGRWVLREACKQARAWVDAGLPPTTMSVNVSGVEMRHESFLQGVLTVLEDTAFDPRSLELELTENTLMKCTESTESTLKSLRARGVQLAIDDFGSGYSSLNYLRRFSIDALKIDQPFVRETTTTLKQPAIVTALISMGRSLNLRIVAEGVETQEELAFLRAHQCDEAQGYFLSPPVLPRQFATMLETGVAEAILKQWPRRALAVS